MICNECGAIGKRFVNGHCFDRDACARRVKQGTMTDRKRAVQFYEEHWDTLQAAHTVDSLEALILAVREDEREACAKECEEESIWQANDCARRIRARSTQ